DDQGSVGLRNTHRLALSSVDIAKAVSASVQARGVQPAPAERAGAVRPEERRSDEFARLDRADIVTNGLDAPNELMPHTPSGLARFHRLVRPKITPADPSPRDAHKRIGRIDQSSIGDV